MIIVGQRTNVKNVNEQQASTHENIMKISKTGKLFTEYGEDYFITNANYPWHDLLYEVNIHVYPVSLFGYTFY
jgi:hypothetical protein